jgi:kynurenine formamidase
MRGPSRAKASRPGEILMRSFCVTYSTMLAALATQISSVAAEPPHNNPRDEPTTAATPVLPTPAAREQIVDLTHTFDKLTIYWPTETGFQFIRGTAGITPKGYYYAANRFAAAEHGGTHLDAPIHFFQDRHTVDLIPLDRLVGDAVVVDVAPACAENHDYQVTITDLRNWETQHKRQLVDVIVLLRTGFGQYWNDRPRYLGTDKTGPAAIAELHFPGLAPEAARWLVEHRAIKSIGIDTASIDYGQSQKFESHVTLCRHNVPVFENIAKLEAVPATGSTVVALPMKIGQGSGAPLRIIAIVGQ